MKSPRFLAAFLAAGMLLTGCGSGGGSKPTNPPTPDVPATSRSQYGPLELTLSTPKTTYYRGEPVVMTFTVKNTSSGPITVDIFEKTLDGRPLYEQVVQNNQRVYRTQGAILGGFPSVEMTSGEVQTYQVGWDQKDDYKRNQVNSGRYSFEVRYDLFRVSLGSIASLQNVQLPNGLTSTEINQLLGPPPIDITVK